jgi:Sulfatase
MAASARCRFRFYAAAPIFASLPAINAAKLYSASVPVGAGQLARDCGILSVIVLLVAGVLMAAPGHDRTKGAGLSLGVLLCGAYPKVAGISDVAPCSLADMALGLAFLTLLVGALWMAVRWRREAVDSLHAILTALVAVVLLYAAHAAFTRFWRTAPAVGLPHVGGPPVTMTSGPRGPDIIHIVFDGLGRLDLLQETYGIDAVRLRSALVARGMTISDDAIANYSQTYPAVAATLSMEYLDEIAKLGRGGNDRRLAEAAIDHSTVIRALVERGYSFTLLSSGYEALVDHPRADDGIFAPTLFDQFESYLLPRTLLRMVPAAALTYEPEKRRTRALLRALESFQPADRPRFVLAHILLPHPPFMFAVKNAALKRPSGIFSIQDGNAFPGSAREYREGYGQQTRFVFAVLERLLEHYRSLSPQPIVIVHGDHGPGLGYDIRTPARSNVRGRMRIFLGVQASPPVDGIGSPVNIYRQVFTARFGAELSPLPDRSFVSSWSRPYDFTEVFVR